MKAVKRYLGNRNHLEVHDTTQTKPSCQINEIKAEHRVWFDTLVEAKMNGFDNCHHCLGGSQR